MIPGKEFNPSCCQHEGCAQLYHSVLGRALPGEDMTSFCTIRAMYWVVSLNHQFSVSHSSSSYVLYVQSTFTVRTLQENLHSICGWESKPRASVHGPILYSQPIRENIAYSTMAASWNTFMEVVPSWISLLVEGGGLLDISWCLVISRKGWLSRRASLSAVLKRRGQENPTFLYLFLLSVCDLRF